jgi:hypothetical protein
MALFTRRQKAAQATIDLRSQPPVQQFGLPTPCPECGANGYLDSIDINERVMYQHCPTCFAKWETSEREFAGTT